jgi:hypothetical protein
MPQDSIGDTEPPKHGGLLLSVVGHRGTAAIAFKPQMWEQVIVAMSLLPSSPNSGDQLSIGVAQRLSTRDSLTMRYAPRIVLGLMMLINLSRGLIHAFAPDGGAHSIAGLDISQAQQTILSLFAILGFHQLIAAGFQFYVLIVRRDLVLLALILQLMETILGVTNLYFYRTLPVVVPGAAFNASLLAVLMLAISIAWRVEPSSNRTQA